MTAIISTPDLLDLSLPVTIITGFLGSGKTILLNQILTQQQGVNFNIFLIINCQITSFLLKVLSGLVAVIYVIFST